MLLLIGSAQVFQHIVFYSDLDFDFDNLLNNSLLSVFCVVATLVWLTAVFQIGQTLSQAVRKFELSPIQRGMALGVAALVAVVAAFLSGNAVHPLLLAGYAIFFAIALDIFSHWERPGFGWTLGWLLLLSLFSATCLYRAATVKDRNQRMEFAEALADNRDPKGAEAILPHLLQAFERDAQKLGFLLKPWPFKAEEIFRYNYLFQHYRLNVYAFDRQNEPLLINQNLTFNQAVQEIWEKGQPLPEAPSIRYHVAEDGLFRYMIRLNTLRMGDAGDPATVYCFLEHEYPKPTRVYARLFYNAPYKGMKGLRRYDFAVQRNGRRVVEQGLDNITALSASVPAGTGREMQEAAENRVYAVYKSADGNSVAAVGRQESSLYKPLFLFSVLFTIASVVFLLLVLANSWLNFLPQAWSEQLSTKGSLAKRIHYGIMTIVGVTFLVIGFLTYRNFTEAARISEQENLDFRAEAILADLKTKASVGLSADSLQRILPNTARQMAGNLSMDVNLYNPFGDLVFSTREDLRQLGVLPAKMNPTAFATLASGKTGAAYTTTEQVAGVDFRSRYSAVYDAGNTLVGFLGTPSDLKNRKPGAEISDFIGALAALYVFFLLVAYVVTMLLADSIIRPVTRISERISKLDFENKNIPLEYEGDPNDELSGLIRRYNVMVNNLEASKNRIVKLEREGAWKEMARQVAHDIKNPLTTMKLSMQQLERVSNNPEQAAAYLRKAITRLIEQIDSLAQIASEFSLFANMDIKNKTDIQLNNVVESVYDLFSEQKNVTLELSCPEEHFHIMGDKNHLIRVFNNLIINAIQAIPSDRQGHIKVTLKQQDNLAVVVLSDNGGGIPPEIRDRVFEPNFTTKTSGSGLGLAICKKIIEAHDGDIRFETRDNEGTDFFVELPIARVEKALGYAF
jgi:signal transduction histidine kinase